MIPGFFGWLDISRDFLAILLYNLKICGSAHVSRPRSSAIKVKPKLFFFLEIFKAQKFGVGFFGGSILVQGFFRGLLEALRIFLGFDIWPIRSSPPPPGPPLSCKVYYSEVFIMILHLDQIGPQWDSNINDFIQREFLRQHSFPKYSCRNRCGKDERDASTGEFFRRLSRCYCDKLCDEFGDCCYDFNAM